MDPKTHPPAKNKSSNSKLTTIDIIGGILCSICKVTFQNRKAYDTHYAEHGRDKEILYTCVVCHREISGYASFRGHCYTSHVIKSRFNCKICSKNFSKQSALMDHEDYMHRFKCQSPCNKEFKSRQDFLLHQLMHKDNKSGPPYPCQNCNEKINSIDSCQKHIEQHATFTYPCPICNDVFSDKIKAGEHLTKHFAGETFEPDDLINDSSESENDCASSLLGIQCGHCEQEFKNKNEIELHFESDHSGMDVTYTCIVCGNPYSKYFMFADHCYNHIQKFKCETCDKPFSRLSLLVNHAHMCGSRVPLRCGHCARRFASGDRLKVHLRDAHAAEMLTCMEPGCGTECLTMRELVLHKMSHKKVKNCCKQCGLEFRSLAACEKHLDVHRTGVYECPVCRKTFTKKYVATKHAPHHFQSVLHVCKICGKIYHAKYRLAEHIKTHSDSRNYECEVCKKGFTTSDNLKQHMNTHTGQKPYKCGACDKSFTSYPNFHKHVRRMHNVDPKSVKKNLLKSSAKEVEAMDVSPAQTSEDDLEMSPSILEESYESVQSTRSRIELDVIDQCLLEEASHFTLNEMRTDTSFAQVNDGIVSDAPVQSTETEAALSAINYPYEYGPEFINYPGFASLHHPPYDPPQVIHLDDHLLPHINPRLTIKQQADIYDMTKVSYEDFHKSDMMDPNVPPSKWEPPIITKIFTYHSDSDTTNLSILKTDIY